jgi:hypothetical protein
MHRAQLVHEGVPHRRPALLEQLGADAQLLAHRQVPASPGAEVGEERHQLDRALGEAVDPLLLVRRIAAAGQHALLDQPSQRSARMFDEIPSFDRRSSSRKCRRLPNIMSRRISKVPPVAEQLQRQVDRALRTGSSAIGSAPRKDCLHDRTGRPPVPLGTRALAAPASSMHAPTPLPTADRPTPLRELALLFLKLGTVAFGGPAAHVAMMEDEVVRRRGWMTREAFLDYVGATALIPGPNSTELAIHIGLARAGWPGLLVAGACFILPAALIVGALAGGTCATAPCRRRPGCWQGWRRW